MGIRTTKLPFVLALITVVVFATPAHADTPVLTDWGGPVITAATVHTLWWGANFDPADQAKVNGFVAAFVGSDYTTVANQYERGATLALTNGDVTYDTTNEPARSPRAAAIKRELLRAYHDNLDPKGIYIVYGDTYGAYGGGGACAWHDYVTRLGVNVPIEYMPDDWVAGAPVDARLCNQYNYPRTMATYTAHETMEAVTDPMPCTAMSFCGTKHGDVAWDVFPPGKGEDGGDGEIADLCISTFANYTLTDGSVWLIQGEWSNAAGGCV